MLLCNFSCLVSGSSALRHGATPSRSCFFVNGGACGFVRGRFDLKIPYSPAPAVAVAPPLKSHCRIFAASFSGYCFLLHRPSFDGPSSFSIYEKRKIGIRHKAIVWFLSSRPREGAGRDLTRGDLFFGMFAPLLMGYGIRQIMMPFFFLLPDRLAPAPWSVRHFPLPRAIWRNGGLLRSLINAIYPRCP